VILAHSRLLREYGPQFGRPRVDTLKGSRHANMKEIRLGEADDEWRDVLAFGPERRALLLVAGDRSDGSERRFYRELIRKAEGRFDRHLARLANEWGWRIIMALYVEDVIAGLDPAERREVGEMVAELSPGK